MKDCPKCGRAEGIINCPDCVAAFAADPNTKIAEDEARAARAFAVIAESVDALARILADKTSDRKWAELSARSKDEWRARAVAFIAECSPVGRRDEAA